MQLFSVIPIYSHTVSFIEGRCIALATFVGILHDVIGYLKDLLLLLQRVSDLVDNKPLSTSNVLHGHSTMPDPQSIVILWITGLSGREEGLGGRDGG